MSDNKPSELVLEYTERCLKLPNVVSFKAVEANPLLPFGVIPDALFVHPPLNVKLFVPGFLPLIACDADTPPNTG